MKYLLLSFAVFFVSCVEFENNENSENSEKTEKPILSEAEAILEEIELIQKNAMSLRVKFEQANVQPSANYLVSIKVISGQEKLLDAYVKEAKQANRLVEDAIEALEATGEDAEKAKEAEERATRGRDQLIEIKTRALQALEKINNLVNK